MNELIRQQFFEYLNKFLTELGKSSKKVKKIIDTDYNDIKNDKCIECIKKNIFIHKEKFLGNENELDEFFKNNSIELLEKINLSDIWNKSEKDNKNAIIQYLKVFVFIFESDNNIVDKNTNESETDSGSEKSDNEANIETNDKFEELLKESLLNNNQTINENMNSFYDSMKDSNNSIIDLAKNIAEDLKNESGDDPNNLMNMFNNGNGINGLISSITTKLDNQIKSGNLDQNKLLNDAQKMMGNNKNLFGDLFKSMNPQNTQMPSNSSSTSSNVTIEEDTEKKVKKKNKTGKKKGTKK